MTKNSTKLLFIVFATILLSAAFVGYANADALVVSCQATPASSPTSPIAIGTAVNFSANVSGGSGTYTYDWFGACVDDNNDTSCQNSFSSAGNYAAYLTVSDGTNTITNSCTAYVRQPCTLNATQQCYNGSVYNFDSCGNQGDLVQTCTNGCSNGACTVPTCTPNATQQCVGNAVYNFDSCGNQGTLVQTCSSNQTCSSGACVTSCTSNATKACHAGSVYWYDSCGNLGSLYQTCTNGCSNGACTVANLSVTATASPNPATIGQTVTFTANATGGTGSYTYSWAGACNGTSSTCTTSYSSAGNYTATVAVTSGTQTQSASASTSIPIQNIVCSQNSDCGANALTGSPFCQSGNVYQNYKTWTCNNPGTANSSCTSNTAPQIQTTCTSSQTCVSTNTSASCVTNQSNINVSCYASPNPTTINQQVSFICNVSGGNGSYSYVWSGACTGSSAVCTTSFPNSGTQTATVVVTSGSQTNSASAAVVINGNTNTCTQNSYQRCSGNYLYWYDSCGNQQSSSQFCPNGCSNNSCQNYINTCTQNSYQRCSGNYLYWYDSCGNQESNSQYCPGGCYNNTCNYNNNYNYNNNNLTVSKTVRDLSSGSSFATSTYASPSDMLMFMITLQNLGSQDAQNVFVRDTLPANLIYANQLVISGSNNGYNNGNYNSNYNYNNYNNYSGNITSGINLNTIPAGQTVTITYQAQVAGVQNFSYGTTTLTNNVSVTSSNSGYTPASNASVIVTRTAVYGASTVSTGLTNNFWTDSFFLPLAIALLGIWMWKSGMFFGIEKWLDSKKKNRKNRQSEKELASRITKIQKLEKI